MSQLSSGVPIFQVISGVGAGVVALVGAGVVGAGVGAGVVALVGAGVVGACVLVHTCMKL